GEDALREVEDRAGEDDIGPFPGDDGDSRAGGELLFHLTGQLDLEIAIVGPVLEEGQVDPAVLLRRERTWGITAAAGKARDAAGERRASGEQEAAARGLAARNHVGHSPERHR